MITRRDLITRLERLAELRPDLIGYDALAAVFCCKFPEQYHPARSANEIETGDAS